MPDWARLAPATETVWGGGLPSSVLAAVSAVDADRLALERSRMTDGQARVFAEPVYSVRNRFGYWERMISRMEAGWQPSGYYLIDEYVNDLESRDQLDALAETVPGLFDGPLDDLLTGLDKRFAEATVDDGGAALRVRTTLVGDGERWRRAPRGLP